MGVRLVRGAGRRGPMRHVYLGLLHPLAGKRPIFFLPALKRPVYIYSKRGSSGKQGIGGKTRRKVG